MSSYSFAPGDMARYTAKFLRSIGQLTDPDGTHGWAKVTGLTSPSPGRTLIHLTWPNGTERKVLDCNLQRQGAPLRVRVDIAD